LARRLANPARVFLDVLGPNDVNVYT
jgi:hypothetical protein